MPFILFILFLANLSDEAISTLVSDLNIGVYYGWVQIGKKGTEVYPMVMSLGWNPYYKNEKRSAVSSFRKYAVQNRETP
jgi:FAD synthase